MILLRYYLCLVASNCSGTALNDFVSRRHFRDVKITLLNGTNSKITWIEYRYALSQKKLKSQLINDNYTLKVAIFNDEDNKFDCRFSATSDNDWDGYSIQMLRLLTNEKSQEFKFSNDTTLKFPKGDFELILCHYNLSNNNENFQQLWTTLSSHFILIYKPSKMTSNKDIFVRTFAGSLWLIFLAVLTLMCVCLGISTSYLCRFCLESTKWTWVEITLWAIAAACQQGLSYTPTKYSSCFIFLLGYLMAYLLYTGFTAGITSTLLQNDIYAFKIENLVNMRLKLVTLSYIFDLDGVKYFKDSQKVDNLDQMFKSLEEIDTVGLAPKILIDQHLQMKIDPRLIKNYAIMLLPYRFSRGLLVNENSNRISNYNIRLLRLKELGIVQNLLLKEVTPCTYSSWGSEYSSASLQHIQSAMLLLLGGALISLVFLIFEFFLAYYKKN